MPKHWTRETVAAETADALLAGQSNLERAFAVIGFDAAVDSIIQVVDVRQGPGRFERMRTIGRFAERIGKAAGKSTNIEFVVVRKKVGGNGPIMGLAMQRLGLPMTFIGAIGDGSGDVEQVFREFAEGCRDVITIGSTAYTDALEFDDGKIMLGKLSGLEGVTYEALREATSIEQLRAVMAEAQLIAAVNWTMQPGLTGIWQGLMDDVLPHLPADAGRRLFIDLADPAKRTRADLQEALRLLARLNEYCPLTLGLNLSEAGQVARAVDVDDVFAAEPADPSGVIDAARKLCLDLQIDRLVIHPREGAAGAGADGESAWFYGPFTAEPTISTGAGDHFNAGISIGAVLRLPLPHQLALGTALSGIYVREAKSPTLTELADFLTHPPE